MTFNPQRAEALRSAIHSTLDWLRIHSGDTATLLTEHLALLQEAELIYLTDAFVGEGEEQIGAESERVLPDLNEFAARNEKFAKDNGLRGDPHAELRKTWAPGQRWQCRTHGEDEWVEFTETPKWHPGLRYRRHPDDIDPSKPWYPDDSGEWAEGHPRGLPPHTEISDFLYAFERKNQKHVALTRACFAHNLTSVAIVAYKVVK